MMRPIRRKYRRGLPVLVHGRTGPFASYAGVHRYIRGDARWLRRRVYEARKSVPFGPLVFARLGTRALRCRERRCYRAMVPIPPNGPSPPPFPFALRRRRFFFSALQHLLHSLVLPHRLAAVYPTATFNSSFSFTFLIFLPPFVPSFLPMVPFLLSTSFVPPELPRSAEEAEHDRRILLCSPRAERFLCGERNLPLDLTFL